MKILFCVSDKEIILTGGRFMQLLYRLQGHEITVCSNSEKVLNNCDPKLEYTKKVLLKPQETIWSMQQRDKFCKKFINAFHEIRLAEDMAMWKAEAFDDYLWNVSQFIYPQIEDKFDYAIFPIPSQEEAAGHLIDEFFTSQIFKCKEEGIKIIGLELLPIQFVPKLFPKIFDFFFVKSEVSKQFLISEYGIDRNNIKVISYQPDNYSLESVEDPFKHYLFKTIQPPRNALNIVLMNHVQMRDELKETVKTIADTGLNFNLLFCCLNYAVKELHEMEIIRDLLMPDFKKYVKKMQVVDISELTQMLISMDVFISMNYLTLFRWCNTYKIPYLVYEDQERLKEDLKRIWGNKQQQLSIGDCLNCLK